MDKQKMYSIIKGNKLVRTLIYPVEILREKRMLYQYQHSQDALYLKSLKDSHKGERCFIIGNGPSLRPSDLDKLYENHEITFGVNRIYYIYPQTKWRPQYYLCIDTVILMAEIDNIKQNGTYPKFINYVGRNYGRRKEENIHYLCVRPCFYIDLYKMNNVLSDDVLQGISKGGTVTANAIELAVYMGFKAIYLLGVDHNYKMVLRKDGTIDVNPNMTTSYFAGMKDPNGKEGDGAVAIPNMEFVDNTYKNCQAFAQAHGVKIYNATRGGKLETFERVDFDSLFE